MSTEVATLASIGPIDSEDLIQMEPQNIDAEMICALTPNDDDSHIESKTNLNTNNMNRTPSDLQNDEGRDDRVYGRPRANTNGSLTLTNPTTSHEANTWRLNPDGQTTRGYNMDGNPTANFDGRVPLSTVKPGPVWPTEGQVKVAYCYGIRRDNGKYTALLPADELNQINFQQVASYQGPEGMIILPPPGQFRPADRTGSEEMVSRALVARLPVENGGLRSVGRIAGYDETQMVIDSIVANTPSGSTPRRQKIYCDKWVHEGTCAFAQLGCKFKHEMPMDKATQVSLGLNHGLPQWFKREQSATLQPPAIRDSARTNFGDWRVRGSSDSNMSNTLVARGPTTPTTAGFNSGVRAGGASVGYGGISNSAPGPSRVLFGPIAPPSRNNAMGLPQKPVNVQGSNPFNTPTKTKFADDEVEDGEIVFRGRPRV